MRRKGHTTPEYVLFSNYRAVEVALVGQKVTHGRAFEATSADTWRTDVEKLGYTRRLSSSTLFKNPRSLMYVDILRRRM